MRKLFLSVLMVALGMTLVSAQTATYGVFVEATQSNLSFADAATALEAAIGISDFQLLGVWDTVVPQAGASYRSRVFVLHDPAYTAEIGKFSGPHAAAALLRINLYEFGAEKALRVNFVNAQTLAAVFLFENGIDTPSFDALFAMAGDVNDKLLNLINGSVGSALLNEQSGPMRAMEELTPYIGDGDAQVMVNFSDYAANYERGFVQAFDSFAAATSYVEGKLANNSEGWELMATLDVGNSRLYGISKDSVEAVSAEIVGGALGASGANPVPGINHNAAYPIEVLVYQDDGKFTVCFPAQMWRMMLYYWDAGIGAFVQYQTLPGEFDASILKALGG